MSVVQGVGNQVNVADLFGGGSSASIQMRFAALQMALASTNKDKATAYMDQIQSAQEESKTVAKLISDARDLQKQAGSGTSEMPADMVKFFTDKGIKWETTGSDNLHNKDEWDYNIKSLTNYQETVGSNTQQLMVFVQDFMGQYNSYLQGSNSAIQQSNQTLQTIARGQ